MKVEKITKTPQGMTIEYSSPGKNGQVSATCYGDKTPHPRFVKEWEVLQETVAEWIETWPPDTKIISVNLKADEKGSIGAVVSMQVKLKDNNRPWNFNAPVKYAHSSGTDHVGFLNETTGQLLHSLCESAQDYVNGVHAQKELFEEENKPNGTTEPKKKEIESEK